jgi:hypothetical protein
MDGSAAGVIFGTAAEARKGKLAADAAAAKAEADAKRKRAKSMGPVEKARQGLSEEQANHTKRLNDFSEMGIPAKRETLSNGEGRLTYHDNKLKALLKMCQEHLPGEVSKVKV